MSLVVLFLVAALVILAALVSATVRESLRPARRATGWALGVGWPLDPEAVGCRYESWELDRPGGVRLPIWDVEGDRADGPVLVLIHGFGRSRLTWLPHLAEWRARASRVLMIDLRGHGEAMPDGSGLGDTDVPDVIELVRRVSEAEGPHGPIVLIGRSLGASVGILAAGESELVDGVIAVAPYETLAVPLSNRIRLRGLPTRLVVPISILVLSMLGRRSRSTTAAASGMTVPLLVVQGGCDQISPPEDARKIADAAPKSRFELVAGAGHGDHWDREPERLDAAVDEFLRGLGSTGLEHSSVGPAGADSDRDG